MFKTSLMLNIKHVNPSFPLMSQGIEITYCGFKIFPNKRLFKVAENLQNILPDCSHK